MRAYLLGAMVVENLTSGYLSPLSFYKKQTKTSVNLCAPCASVLNSLEQHRDTKNTKLHR